MRNKLYCLLDIHVNNVQEIIVKHIICLVVCMYGKHAVMEFDKK